MPNFTNFLSQWTSNINLEAQLEYEFKLLMHNSNPPANAKRMSWHSKGWHLHSCNDYFLAYYNNKFFWVNLTVYLRTDPEVAYKRIGQRGRSEENSIKLEYLQSVHKHHEDWLVHKKKSLPCPVRSFLRSIYYSSHIASGLGLNAMKIFPGLNHWCKYRACRYDS